MATLTIEQPDGNTISFEVEISGTGIVINPEDNNG